jgi:hypothetical protein
MGINPPPLLALVKNEVLYKKRERAKSLAMEYQKR